MYIYTHIYICTRTYVCMYICIFIYMYICTCIHMYIHTYLNVYICMCTYVDIHTSSTYVHVYTERVCVLFIGTQFSNLYTAVDTPARGRVGECVVFVCLVFACKYVLGLSRVSQPLNLRLYLLRHLGFLTSPHASPICRRHRLNSYRLFRRFTPDPPPIPRAYPLYLPASPRPPLYTPTMKT